MQYNISSFFLSAISLDLSKIEISVVVVVDDGGDGDVVVVVAVARLFFS